MNIANALVILITSVLSSVISGAVVAFVSVPIAMRRFRSERLWERRLQAYTDILIALSDMIRYAREALARLESQGALGADALAALAAKSSDGRSEIRRAAAIGSLLLDEDAVKCLKRLESALDDPHYNEDLQEEITADLAISKRSYAELAEIASRTVRGAPAKPLRTAA